MRAQEDGDTGWGLWTLAVLALVAYALAAHIPIFLTMLDVDTPYASGHIDLVPINLGAPFALLYAALLTVLARRWFGAAGVPTCVLARAARFVAVLAVGFVSVFLAYVEPSPAPAVAVLAKVVLWSVLTVIVVPLTLAAMALKGVPAATVLTLAVLGLPSIGPLAWLAWRARGEMSAA